MSMESVAVTGFKADGRERPRLAAPVPGTAPDRLGSAALSVLANLRDVVRKLPIEDLPSAVGELAAAHAEAVARIASQPREPSAPWEDPDELFTTAEAAKAFRTLPSRIVHLIRVKKLAGLKVGRGWVMTRRELQACRALLAREAAER